MHEEIFFYSFRHTSEHTGQPRLVHDDAAIPSILQQERAGIKQLTPAPCIQVGGGNPVRQSFLTRCPGVDYGCALKVPLKHFGILTRTAVHSVDKGIKGIPHVPQQPALGTDGRRHAAGQQRVAAKDHKAARLFRTQGRGEQDILLKGSVAAQKRQRAVRAPVQVCLEALPEQGAVIQPEVIGFTE